MIVRDPREIPLTLGFVALVDAADYDDLAQFKWHVYFCGGRGPYAARCIRRADGRRRRQLMHRVLLPDVPRIDHRNGDPVDNRRGNLRPATQMENLRNRVALNANNTSGFRGVSWHKAARKWQALITVAGRPVHLGLFDSVVDAAEAFDAAAVELFGDFVGYLNFPRAMDVIYGELS